MKNREITIGRSTTCDISLGDSCEFASAFHGKIYYDGNLLVYKDMSRNGTIINNRMVHGKTVRINRGDSIIIAGRYEISWSQIDSLLLSSINSFKQTKLSNEKKKYCTQCGTQLNERANFCPKCGSSMNGKSIAVVRGGHNKVVKQKKNFDKGNVTQSKREHKVNKKTVYALIGTLGVLMLIVFGSMFYSEFEEAREARLAREMFVADSLEQARKESIKLAELREKERIDSIENARIISLQRPYLELLDKYGSKEEHEGEYYFLYDLNGDDFPEIWLQVIENEEFKLLVFSNIKEEAVLLFRTSVGHPYHHSFYLGSNYVLMNFAHMGSQVINKFYLKNGIIKEENIFTLEEESLEEAEYKEITESEATIYEITDKSPIYEIK